MFAVLGLAVLVPLVWGAVRAVFGARSQVPVGGDYAVLEIYVLHAKRLTQMLGPYSRFHWNHPGPFYFYLLLPFYVAFGETSRGLLVGASTINLLSLVGAVWIVREAFSTSRAVLFLALVGLTVRFLGFEALSDPWNSLVSVLPAVVFLVLAWLFSTGRPWGLLGMVVVGSFLVQTHAFHASLVVAAGTVAFVLGVLELRGPGRDVDHVRRVILLPLTVSLAAAFVLWFPPLWEEATRPEGNLTKMVQFLGSQPRAEEGWADVAAAIDEPLAGVPLGALASLGHERMTCAVTRGLDCIDARLPWSLPVHLALLAAGVVVAIRLRRRETVYLGLVTAAGLLAGVWALSNVQAQDTPYLPLWPAALGITTYLTVFDAFLPGIQPERRVRPGVKSGRDLRPDQPSHGSGPSAALRFTVFSVALLLIALFAYSNLRHALGVAPYESLSEPNWQGFDEGEASYELAAEINDFFAARPGPHRPVVRLVQHGVWPVVAAVVLHEYHAGRPLAVEPNWLFMFGERFTPTGEETEELLFGGEHFHRCASTDPNLAFVAMSQRIYVYQRAPLVAAHPHCPDLAFVAPG